MRRELFFAAFSCLSACAFAEPRRPAADDDVAARATVSSADAQIQANIRSGERAQNDGPIGEELLATRTLDGVRHAFQLALGRASVGPGIARPRSGSAAMRVLVAAKVPMQIVQRKGGPATVPGYELASRNLERAQMLDRKRKEQTASPAERKEAARLAKSAPRLDDVKWQVTTLGLAAVDANLFVETQTLQTARDVRARLSVHKMYGMDLDEGDLHWIARKLTVLRRLEAAAAATTAALAAYQASASGSGDPRAIDELSQAALASLDAPPTASQADARAYVASFSTNYEKGRAWYEKAMREVHGDDAYEQQIKPGLDAMYAMDAQAAAYADERARARDATAQPRPPAADVSPDGPLKESLQGLAALNRGDTRTAFKSALNLASHAPGGSTIKSGILLAGKLLGYDL
jgi:hypothetical protein